MAQAPRTVAAVRAWYLLNIGPDGANAVDLVVAHARAHGADAIYAGMQAESDGQANPAWDALYDSVAGTTAQDYLGDVGHSLYGGDRPVVDLWV
jgi:hypothetical protein